MIQVINVSPEIQLRNDVRACVCAVLVPAYNAVSVLGVEGESVVF